MNPFLTLAVNLTSCPGVTSSGLEHRPDGTVCVTAHGGNPKVVGAMILRCLPPGTPTAGDTVVEIEGTVVQFDHVDPTPEQPEDFVAPLPLKTPEGRHEPRGVPYPRTTTQRALHANVWVLLVGGILIAGIIVSCS